MHIDSCIYADEVTPQRVKGRNCVIIDVFRATSVIITALDNGASRVTAVTDVEEAFEVAERLKSKGVKTILGGERNVFKVEGFDKDNSPLSYRREDVEGAEIVFTTTNGTKAINKSREAEHIYIGALINAEAVCRRLLEEGRDITLVCSGREGNYTLEDALCAGMIASRLEEEAHDCFLTDITRTMLDIYRLYEKDFREGLKHSQHYNRIMSLGIGKDVEYCLRRNIIETVPHVNKEGYITL